jgi:hypothetical protein
MFQLSTRSIEPSFGLLFGDKLRDMGVATTGASVIISALDATINISGMHKTCFSPSPSLDFDGVLLHKSPWETLRMLQEAYGEVSVKKMQGYE